MERQTNTMPGNAEMNPNGSAATDLDFSTTATARDLDEPTSTGADYPENMTNSGYGGSNSTPGDTDDEEYDEEELTITDDDDDDDDIAAEEDDEEDDI